MKRQGFLDDESRRDLIELARYGLAANRLSHRANALVLLDDGMIYATVARVLLLVDDMVRTWRVLEDGIAAEFGIEYRSRSSLFALLHRLGMEYRKPKAISRKLEPEKQAAFIKTYQSLLKQLADDEAVVFADAVHPNHAVRPVGCWSPKDVPVASVRA